MTAALRRLPRCSERGAVPKALVVVLCIVALAVSAFVLYRHLGPAGGDASTLGDIEWICEKCGRPFHAPAVGRVPRCPRCGEIGHCVYRYRCTRCGATFEAFRTRGRPGEPMQMKAPGGPWRPFDPASVQVRCPQCKADAVERLSPPEL